jgi:hypothetical protein
MLAQFTRFLFLSNSVLLIVSAALPDRELAQGELGFFSDRCAVFVGSWISVLSSE